MTQGPQQLVDEINGIVEAKKAEARAEQRIRQFVSSKKRFSAKAIALLTIGRGALIADMGSR